MTSVCRWTAFVLVLSAPFAAAQVAPSKPAVTTPKQFFGFDIGDDYCLANYQQLKGYWEKLQTETDRMKLVTIGQTEEGRPQLAAVVTSPANHKKLDRLREISGRLAQARGVTADDARTLAAEGKAVVWIDGGLHASETLCAQALIETLYRFASATDAETLRILDDVVILFVHANPDGHDLVADWYMKEKTPTRRTLAGLPRLYQKYIGHDNNRDFYANTQAETKNLNRFMYREWFPQIVYNHHQTGPAGTVLFCPPFRDPFNYFCDPLVLSGIDAVGAAMMQRFLVEGKIGATSRSGAPYSTWFNGGLRTTSGFHNMIGILTETIGSPTPTQIPLVAAKQLPKADYLAPIPPQTWHFRQSVEYSVTANRAILDYASRHREQLLFNVWLMGHNAIAKGEKDSWTITPQRVEAAVKDKPAAGRPGSIGGRGTGGVEFDKHFRKPEHRDARGYILPADQPDFPTAARFVNALLGTGVQVHQATADFTVEGKTYPKGSYVVKSAQAYRAHVLDMFEPQDHPNDFAYPGGPPIKPYDSAGYTLAYQMGLTFDRVLVGFDGPFAEIRELAVAPLPAAVTNAADAAGYFLSPRLNDSFRAVNRLHKAGIEVRRLDRPYVAGGIMAEAGTFYIPAGPKVLPVLEKLAKELGTPFRGTPFVPQTALVLKPVRVGLWDRHGGSMPSGWTRWIFEQFEFPYTIVTAPELDAGKLRDKFDVILLVDGAYTGRGGPAPGEGEEPKPAADAPSADPSASPRGSITAAKTVPELKKFLEAGGTLLTIGSSTRLSRDLGLPVANHLADIDEDAREKPIASDKFYVPSSVLRVKVDTANSLAWGVNEQLDVMFSSSPTFRLTSGAAEKGVKRVAWFDTKTPLRSGWAWGQSYLEGGTAIVDAKVGAGRCVLFGPQVLFRGQSHGSFKLVFNAIVQHGLGGTTVTAREHLSPYGLPSPVLVTSGGLPADFENKNDVPVLNTAKDTPPAGFQFLAKSDDLPAAGRVGLYVPPEAVVRMQGRTVANVGQGVAAVRFAKSPTRDARTVQLEGKKTADYNELRRVAMERAAGSPYPPKEPAAPVVPKGTLVIVGGAGLPADISKRFLDAGGGEGGHFVVLPVSMPDPIRTTVEESFLKKMGAKNVTVIPFHEQRDLEDPKVLDTLKKATGLWFGGGRQWNFVDAYEGTKLPALFRDVLARGGVIGGSSAGATIQGDYMVRGAPAGPNVMMCEGYEQALGFMPGVAIDQHFTARNRFKDMTAFMKAYPQFLGIGLDEATAIVVTGSTAEILGKGKAHFYDAKRLVKDGDPDYDAYPAGLRYDLVKRAKIMQVPPEPN